MLVLGIILIVYFLLLNLIMGRIHFSEVFLILGAILIVYSFNKDKLMKYGFFITLKNVFKPIIIVCLVIFIISEVCILGFALKKNTETTDYIVILGAGLKGKEVSLTLKQRLDAAIKYIDKYDSNVKIIVSGGQGPGEDISEALAMKTYLVDNGIKGKNIIMEDKSTNTFENFKYCKEKLKEIDNRPLDKISVKVITNNFHSLRSYMIAKRLGYDNVNFYSSKTNIFLVPVYFTREFFALSKSLIFDR